MQKNQIVNPLEVNDWNNLILNHPESSIFHTSNWAQVLKDTYNYIPHYLISYNNEGLITTLVPLMEVSSYVTGKRGVSLPFTDYSEPILNCNFNEALDDLTTYANLRSWNFLEFRGCKKISNNIIPSSFFYHHSLDLTQGQDKTYLNFFSSNNRNIKKAIREDIQVIFSKTTESIDHFYKLNCITRKRHGLPPQPYIFFYNIYKNILSNGLGEILLRFSR